MKRFLMAVLIAMVLGSCASKPKVALAIVSGSENQTLEPIVKRFAEQEGIDITVSYKGSLDIMLALENGAQMDADVLWPANSLWLRLGDMKHVVKYEKSVMRSPVVFGVKKSVAEELGWIGKDVAVADILAAAESGKLRFAMTSATQSNSGASAYLGFLHALAGSPEVLTMDHLHSQELQDKVARLLRTINRSSGSSGWLSDMVVNDYARFDAMVNYECLIIEANRRLLANGQEPMIAIYPVDGLMVADSPLGLVDKGDKEKEQAFQKLQAYLLSEPVRAEIEQQGRRAGVLGLEVGHPDKRVFNPDWGMDTSRIIAQVPLPAENVVREALNLYQTALRKPSLTVYVLDYSGSMEGEGVEALQKAMETLLEPELAKRYMLQSSPKDIHVVIPFNGEVIATWQAVGNDRGVLRQLLNQVRGQQVGGGTDIYAGLTAAFKVLDQYGKQMTDYFPAVILMTDGRSDGNQAELLSTIENSGFGRDVPLFSITFGDADASQLQDLRQYLSGDVFDGSKNLVDTFRKAKGYN